MKRHSLRELNHLNKGVKVAHIGSGGVGLTQEVSALLAQDSHQKIPHIVIAENVIKSGGVPENKPYDHSLFLLLGEEIPKIHHENEKT